MKYIRGKLPQSGNLFPRGSLQPLQPLVAVEIINPFNLKQFAQGKVSAVDIKARDDTGNWYIIEIQTTVPSSVPGHTCRNRFFRKRSEC